MKSQAGLSLLGPMVAALLAGTRLAVAGPVLPPAADPAPVSSHTGAPAAERLKAASRALDAGDAESAFNLYEQLSGEGEFVDAEVGMVRAAFANGETRKAVAYASRVAGENKESLDAQLWLAFLVDRTGKPELALDSFSTHTARDAREGRLLATVHAELLIDRGRPKEALAELDALPATPTDAGVEAMRRRALRALGSQALPELKAAGNAAAWPAPYSEPLRLHGELRAAAGGVAVDDGRRVLTQLDTPVGTRVVVRNGAGLVHPGVIERVIGVVAVIRLDAPFPTAMALDRRAYARADSARFCFALGNRVMDPERRGVPAVYPGIVFRRLPDSPYVAITADVDGSLRGTPVFDSRGRLLGIDAGSGRASGHPEAVALAAATESFAEALGVTADPESADTLVDVASPKPTIVELYERLAASSVAVFVAGAGR